jgi:hypothetical protein
MRDEGSGEDAEDFPPDDPTSVLEGLDAELEGFGAPDPDEPLPSASPLSRREIDELVDRMVSEELERLERKKSGQ